MDQNQVMRVAGSASVLTPCRLLAWAMMSRRDAYTSCPRQTVFGLCSVGRAHQPRRVAKSEQSRFAGRWARVGRLMPPRRLRDKLFLIDDEMAPATILTSDGGSSRSRFQSKHTYEPRSDRTHSLVARRRTSYRRRSPSHRGSRQRRERMGTQHSCHGLPNAGLMATRNRHPEA